MDYQHEDENFQHKPLSLFLFLTLGVRGLLKNFLRSISKSEM
jgi:hypothetical protein